MKEEEQTDNRQQLKGDDTENKRMVRSNKKNKPKEITLENGEKEICMGCNKHVETVAQCGIFYRWYH